MAALRLLDVLFARLAVRSSSSSSTCLHASTSTSTSTATQFRQYATHANLLGSLKPSKGATHKVHYEARYYQLNKV